MTKQDSHDTDLSMQSADMLIWRVMRARRRSENKHKREIVIARPRERNHAHDAH